MADFLDFVPLAQETVESIRARMDYDANAGVDPASADFIDTTEGGFFFDITQTAALEIARLWDFAATEVPAVVFPKFAYGSYLDDHGETLGLERKDATKATGIVRFSGTDTTEITTGTQVATLPAGEDADPETFQTTEGGTITGGYVDLTVEAVDGGTAGNVATDTITVLVTPVYGVTAVTNQAATAGGSDVETDEEYRARIVLALSAPQGAGNSSDYEQWALAYAGVGGVTVVPLWDGAGTVLVVVTDAEKNPASQEIVAGLQDQLDPPGAETTLDGAQALNGGTITVVSTADFASSGKFRCQGQSVTYTGKTGTTFTGCTGGTATPTIASGTRVIQASAAADGLAPVGADVTVATVTAVTVYVVGNVTYEAGFSEDGAGGTVAVGEAILGEIAGLIDALDPGEDVVFNNVESRFFRADGVYDVANVGVTKLMTTTTGSNSLGGTNFTLNVAATTGFASTGTLYIEGGHIVTYGGTGASSFTSCNGGSGTVAAGTKVYALQTANVSIGALEVALLGGLDIA